jgi:RNA polymerase sigma factor (sigma-70 family)
LGCNYEDLFQDWEIGIVTRLIGKFQRRWTCLKQESFEELLQECLCHWHFSKNSHDPQGEASQKTFMARIIENKLIDLARERESDKRRVSHLAVSLNEPAGNDEDSRALIDTVHQGSMGGIHPDPFKQIELRLDLSIMLCRLTPRQKELCRLLGEEGLTIKEASGRLNVPRTSLYDEIKRIRTIFRSEHLDEYLKDFFDPSPTVPGKNPYAPY